MMPLRPADDFGLRLAVFYGCLFLIPGIQMPFFPLWLKARGLDSEAIGIILATPVVVRIFAVPVINRAIDRTGKIRGGMIAAALAGAFGFSVVGFSHGFVAIMLAVALAPLSPVVASFARHRITASQRTFFWHWRTGGMLMPIRCGTAVTSSFGAARPLRDCLPRRAL
jgi:PPP family 3-phenylpropionic acid transporter